MGVIIVTGATGAIGGAAVQMLRQRGHEVIGTSRRPDSQGWYTLDVSRPDSIVAFVQKLTEEGIRLDGLLNNAGTLQREYHVTPDGFELVTATNYLGTYLLTRKLLPMMNEGAHVVCTASLSCYVARLGKDFFDLSADNYRQIKAYSNSKMALVYFAQELHRRYGKHLHVNLTDPGIVNSRMIHLDRWFDSLADIAFRQRLAAFRGLGAEVPVDVVHVPDHHGRLAVHLAGGALLGGIFAFVNVTADRADPFLHNQFLLILPLIADFI